MDCQEITSHIETSQRGIEISTEQFTVRRQGTQTKKRIIGTREKSFSKLHYQERGAAVLSFAIIYAQTTQRRLSSMEKSYLEKIKYIDQLSVMNTALFKRIYSKVLNITPPIFQVSNNFRTKVANYCKIYEGEEVSELEPEKLGKNCTIFILNYDEE